MTRPPLPRFLTVAFAIFSAGSLVASVASARVSIPLTGAFGGAAWPGAATVSTPSDLLADPFTYNPDLNYVNYASIPTGFLPSTPWNGGDTVFIANNNDASNYWGANVTLTAGQTLEFLDIWGRSDYAGAEQTRHQNLVINFYNAPGGAAGGGTLLGASPEYSGVTPKAANNAIGSAYGRFDVTSVLNATQRAQVQSIEISHGPTNVNDFLLLSEVRAGTGLAAPPLPVLTINRNTGAASIFNGPAAPLNFIAYSITSNRGALKEGTWTSIATTGDGNSGGSIDTDNWIEFTAAGATDNLSEGELPGGNGVTLNQGQSINLGSIWTRNPNEDVAIQLLKADGTNAPVLVEYTGNGGVAFKVGDLNFDGAVGAADWPVFRTGMGSAFTGQSLAQTYGAGDFDGDFDVDIADFRRFEVAYDAVNGSGSLSQLIASVPEPGSLALVASAALALIAIPRRRKVVTQLACVVAILTAASAQDANAQTFTLVPNPTGPVTSNSEFSAAFAATNLFGDATLTSADLGVKLFNQETGQYAGVGLGPVNVFVDNGTSITTNWIGYAQRIGGIANADRVGKIEVWFSNSDFAGTLPATPAQATVNIGDPASNLFNAYPLLTTLTGRYAAMRLTISDYSLTSTANNIGGHEFRFVQGPAPLTLQVNTSTGAIAIKNPTGGSAQAVSLDGYQITSSAGSLNTAWSGLGGQAGFPEGNGTGNGWESGGGSNSKLLTEAYLLGGSTVATGASINLGTGYNSGVNVQDLKFMYSYENSAFTEGLIEYISSPGGAPADFDGDGDVDGGDFLRWQQNFGLTSGATKAQGDADGNGAVNAADLAVWKGGFGAATPAGGAVPEPASVAMLAIGGIAMVAACRRRRVTARAATTCLCAAVVCSATIASASVADRDYRMGDNSALSTENGAAGIVVGSGAGNINPGFTLDHTGLEASLPTFQDLSQVGSPLYVNVGPSPGLARPGAVAGSLGIGFDGTDDRLRGNGLGNPSHGDDAFESAVSYNTLTTRAVQGWVRPTAPSAANARQRVVRDTHRFGISIVANAQGVNQWAMNTDGVAALQETVSPATVNFNQWSHVMHFANGTYSAMFVNGIAVAARGGGYGATNTGTASDKAFSLGADLGGDEPTVTASNFFTGQMDDWQALVAGNNSAQTNGANYGAFSLAADNQWIAAQTLVVGDVTGDGLIMGDGAGGANDDVKKFVDNFRYRNIVNNITIGDYGTRTQRADLNFDGFTDLRDWYILAGAHQNAAAVNIEALVGGVPEPSSMALASVAALAFAGARRRRS